MAAIEHHPGGGEFANIAFNQTFVDDGGNLVTLSVGDNSIFLVATPEPASIALWLFIAATLTAAGYLRRAS